MSILTKNALSASNQASFPNNTTGAITPQILRDFNQDVIDTLVDSLNTGSYALTDATNNFITQQDFTSISASSFVSASEFVGDGSKLTNITASIAIPISDEGILQGIQKDTRRETTYSKGKGKVGTRKQGKGECPKSGQKSTSGV